MDTDLLEPIGLNSETLITGIVVAVFVVVAIFLIFRWLILWYYKINKIVTTLEDIESAIKENTIATVELLDDIKSSLTAQQVKSPNKTGTTET